MAGKRTKRGNSKRTTNALEIIAKDVGNAPDFHRLVQEEVLNMEVAQLIHDARTAAGLTQRELAERIGSRQPVIARLEDADYGGHSLTMLRRIAEALDLRVEIRFVPAGGKPSRVGS